MQRAARPEVQPLGMNPFLSVRNAQSSAVLDIGSRIPQLRSSEHCAEGRTSTDTSIKIKNFPAYGPSTPSYVTPFGHITM